MVCTISGSGSDRRAREEAIASSGVTEPLRMGTSSGSNNLTTGEGGDRLGRGQNKRLMKARYIGLRGCIA